MNKYTVVIHYEGAYDAVVEANSEDDAREIAARKFEDAPIEEVMDDGMDWEICDIWEEENDENGDDIY